jgi:shikimate dehydrogenase
VIAGSTRVAGVIGDPVSHSRSPQMHNAAYAALGLDWVYVPLPVAADRLEAALRGLAALGFAGANVTIPHKEAAARVCDELSTGARRSGTVNTVVVADGRLRGETTDGPGLVAAIERAGAGATLAGEALLVGAGGAARAAAVALVDAGAARVTVSARRPEASAAIAGALAPLAPGRVEAAASAPAEAPAVVVNATPVGQRDDALPLDPALIGAGTLVCDLAYRADGSPTPLAAAARARGATVVDGLDVLVEQGVLAFALLTGRDPPRDVIESAARARDP